MLDNQLLSDSELCARVKALDPGLAALLGARLRRLRLGRVVSDQADQAPTAAIASPGEGGLANPASSGEG